MSENYKSMAPHDIERRSFEIISEILAGEGKQLPPEFESIIKRVIHTTADFEYADTLYFSPGVLDAVRNGLKAGAHIVTDTNMARAGINTKKIKPYNVEVHCFIADPDIIAKAKGQTVTRAILSMEKAAKLKGPVIFALGNAPTALMRLCEMAEAGEIKPAAIIGVPVGFVNVVEAKEILIDSGIPCIVSRGRKGGSNVAAAIMNAISYSLD